MSGYPNRYKIKLRCIGYRLVYEVVDDEVVVIVIAIPIVWTLLNKRGNSDTKERIALIQRFISIFGKDRIVNVFADREFIGEQWFTWLIEQDINFCIRIKKTSLSPII